MRSTENRSGYIGGLKVGIVGVLVTCFVVLLCMVSARCAQPAQDPPDLGYELSRCTRVEIEFEPSTLEYFFPTDEQRSLLSKEEAQVLESLTKIVSDNQRDIKDVAIYDLTMGYYTGRAKGEIGIKNRIHLVGFTDNTRAISFTIIGTVLRTEDGHEYRYDRGLPHLHLLMSQVWPFALRVGCELNLTRLGNALSDMSDDKAFPSAAQWCDDVLWHERRLNSDGFSTSTNAFECPGARTCHYAMNSACKPNSPGDMVLLFEARPAWNQHGGPELFTFDNHDPKGGLVLLNDGTVKFIRTEEELQQLRWK